MKIQNQRGFAVVEGILIVVVIGLLSGVGYYVYNANRESNKNQTDSSISKKEKKLAEQQKQDETALWKEVTSGKRAFKIRIPDGWTLNNDPAQDLLISSENPSDVMYKKGQAAIVTSKAHPGSDAPVRFLATLNNEKIEPYKNSESAEFTLNNGVKGARYYHLETTEAEGLGPIKGQKSYSYDFEKNGKFYHIGYSILPGDPDNLEIVEKAIKTLQF